ncbi:hypothetical protein B0H67DRAFT_639495 [Lasiosphaeris hirsuta]|uniref:Uncharacterized protein n=1 Tax=Lasiosphaeris hirsuta TaxID=260670 RepID=A0AA40BB90_9PEZI|nr:hypothetical protein B0H67DRAFT_639495 [Lasiosphaeris hirsuta]
MARIQRAQAKGQKDVRLSKEELAAFERHRQREEEEGRKKRREQRIAVPLSQFDLSSRKRRDSGAEDDSPPRRHSPGQIGEQQRDVPPMGYFPPPSSRSLRPHSGTGSRPSSRAPADRDRGDSPFTYSYVNPEQGASSRYPSNPSVGRPISRTSIRGDSGAPSQHSPAGGSSSVSPTARLDVPQQPQVTIDPFQYMTGGVRAPSHAGASSARRSVAAAPGDSPYTYGTGPMGDSRRSVSGGESSSDNGNGPNATPPGHGARVNSSGSASRGRVREGTPLAEERPKPPEPERRSTRDRSPHTTSTSKKVSSILSPVRRKSILGSSSSSSKSKRKGK